MASTRTTVDDTWTEVHGDVTALGMISIDPSGYASDGDIIELVAQATGTTPTTEIPLQLAPGDTLLSSAISDWAISGAVWAKAKSGRVTIACLETADPLA